MEETKRGRPASLCVDEEHSFRHEGYDVTWWLADSDSYFFALRIRAPDGTMSEGTIAPQDSLYLRDGEPGIPQGVLESLERELWDRTG